LIKVLTVIGARPQFIKAAALSVRFMDDPGITEVIVHTGQHYDENMSQVFFNELSIPSPKYVLKKPSGNNLDMIANHLIELNKIIKLEQPDYLLVYGDTDSTLSGAIAANKNCVNLIHIESGLRSFNLDMPEENNRKLADCIADLLFTTDKTAQANLRNENISGKSVLVGDIMLETLSLVRDKLPKPSRTINYAIATIHRPSNIDSAENLEEILKALVELSKQWKIIIPTHPRSRKIIADALIRLNVSTEYIELIDPVGYLDMMSLVQYSQIVLTDSGGLQKEAVYLKRPCLVLRCETEWKFLENNNFVKVLDKIKCLEIVQKAHAEYNCDFSLLPDATNVSFKICKELREYHNENFNNN
jgi:UDP-GlcNAc3NAcA epimerase